jgi:hypothetical protein
MRSSLRVSSPMISPGPFLLLFAFFNVLFAQSASAADGAIPNAACKLTTTFPDGAKFADPCLMTILPAGQDAMAPKGWIKFFDTNKQDQVFSLNFFPPKEIKVKVPYTVTTDTKESFLNGIVQPAAAHELCRMTSKFPSTGTITFTAVGTTAADYHGTLQVYPACYVNLGTPQQTLVPSGKVGGGSMVITF